MDNRLFVSPGQPAECYSVWGLQDRRGKPTRGSVAPGILILSSCTRPVGSLAKIIHRAADMGPILPPALGGRRACDLTSDIRDLAVLCQVEGKVAGLLFGNQFVVADAADPHAETLNRAL